MGGCLLRTLKRRRLPAISSQKGEEEGRGDLLNKDYMYKSANEDEPGYKAGEIKKAKPILMTYRNIIF